MKRPACLVLFLALTAVPASAQRLWLTAGGSSSSGFGEQPLAPMASLVTQGGIFGLEAEGVTSWNGANKYTGAGWAFRQSLDVAALPVGPVGIMVGADYRYRDGGPWSKQAIWLRSGFVWSRDRWTVKTVVRLELWQIDAPEVRLAQWEIRHRLSRRWMLALTQGVGTYQQPERNWGLWSDIEVGWRLR